MPVVVGSAILSADWLSAVVVAVTLPLIPVFMILVGWMTRTVVGRRWRVQQRLAHHFADLVAGLPTLQVFDRAKAQAEALQRTGEAHRRGNHVGPTGLVPVLGARAAGHLKRCRGGVF